MLNPEFVKWMAYELNGRAMMHAITANMARRFNEGAVHVYWSSYHQLEAFSKPRYEHVARVFGIELPNESWISVKSRVVSWLPGFMIPGAISGLRNRTVAYIEHLRWLSGIGPAEEKDFYAYMVRQEALQVRLMDVALGTELLVAKGLVEQFIAQETVVRQLSL
ncbi:hypothetical protein [Pseudomonas citronellolis]|uniref:hypothetical protein n=1 Tax=Pseudomonas citronellolis TaxID=53408 RepID=UPI0011C0F513|nr:hypothetical protein [Pseudomonas citronellolis]